MLPSEVGPRTSRAKESVGRRSEMPRKSAPGAQKLDSVAHFFCCERADQAQQAPHLLADGIALLCRQDNPSVALSGSHQVRVKADGHRPTARDGWRARC